MEHREYIRDIPNSKIAVLMIHGIIGTPAHFRDLIPNIPDNCTIHNILLDGNWYLQSPVNFLKTTRISLI